MSGAELRRVRVHPPEAVVFDAGPAQLPPDVAREVEQVLLEAVGRALAGANLLAAAAPAPPAPMAGPPAGGGPLLAFSLSESAADQGTETAAAPPPPPDRLPRRERTADRAGSGAKRRTSAGAMRGPTRLRFRVRVDHEMDQDDLLREFVRQYYRITDPQEVERRLAWWHWTDKRGRSVTKQDADRRYLDLTVTDATETETALLPEAERERIEAETEERLRQAMGLPAGTKAGTGPEAAARRRGVQADVVEEHLRREVADLPEDVRRALLVGDRPLSVPDLTASVRLGRRLAAMTPEQRAAYLDTVTAEPGSWTELDASVDRFLADERARAAETARTAAAAAPLFGREELYLLWRTSKNLDEQQSFGMAEHPPPPSDEQLEAHRRLTEALARCSLTEEAFEASVNAYLGQFRAEAVRIALDILAHIDHQLQEERRRLRTPGYVETMVAAIARTSAPAEYTRAVHLEGEVEYNPALGDYVPKEGLNRIEAAELRARADRETAIASGHDLLVDPERLGRGTDRAKLSHLDADAARAYLLEVADRRQADGETVRQELAQDPERVFSQPGLVEATKRSLGVKDRTVYAWIVDDHIEGIARFHVFTEAAVVAITLLLAALVPVGGWVAAAAVLANLAITTAQAVRAIEEYQEASAEYDLRFIANEPSLLWVALAVASVALELHVSAVALLKRGANAKGLFSLRNELHEFGEAKDAATATARYRDLLTKIDEVEGLEPRLAEVLKARAAAEQGLKRVLGEFAGRLHGGFLVDPTGPMEAMYYLAKKHVATVEALRGEARIAELLGDITRLSPAEQEAITTAYARVKEIVKIAEERGIDDAVAMRYVDRLAAERSAAVFEEIVAELHAWRPPTPEQLRAGKALAEASERLRALYAERDALLRELRARPKTPTGARDDARIAEIEAELDKLSGEFVTRPGGVRERVAGKGEIAEAHRAMAQAEEVVIALRVDPLVRMRQVFNASRERAEVVASGEVDQVGTLGVSSGRLEVDHVVSLSRITRMEGFELLTAAEQNSLAVRRKNLRLMDASANASKGEHTFATWPNARYYYPDAADLARSQALEAELIEEMQTWIRTRVKNRRPVAGPQLRAPTDVDAPPPGQARIHTEPAQTRIHTEAEPLPDEPVEAPAQQPPLRRRAVPKPER
ncbi:hypothetical protein [Kitasatospora griseola]|uniref:hypothetical protein n=1 Tax=Kitasatospora griseola TaxID=2064 RepID=UPI00166FFFA1|nr:hypothetical protein [Kitasatospora griseola]GGQ66954.1 hypothetical protein GCM10010195_23070 [Kitasatospora griseola]